MSSEPTSMLKHIIAILDCFTTDQNELGVREVARQADLATSTAGRLMADMKELGILQQNAANRTYSLGTKILAWSGVLSFFIGFADDCPADHGRFTPVDQRDCFAIFIGWKRALMRGTD